MAVITEGYNSKPLSIRISGRKYQNAEVWVEQEGLPDEPGFTKYRETLSYATVQELIQLKSEIEEALKEIIGIKD